MNYLAEVHDTCLEYELAILQGVEELADRRMDACRQCSPEKFKEIIPILESIQQGAELYKEYLDELKEAEECQN